MTNRKIIFILALFVASMPFLGLPRSYDEPIFVTAGLLIALFTVLIKCDTCYGDSELRDDVGFVDSDITVTTKELSPSVKDLAETNENESVAQNKEETPEQSKKISTSSVDDNGVYHLQSTPIEANNDAITEKELKVSVPHKRVTRKKSKSKSSSSKNEHNTNADKNEYKNAKEAE